MKLIVLQNFEIAMRWIFRIQLVPQYQRRFEIIRQAANDAAKIPGDASGRLQSMDITLVKDAHAYDLKTLPLQNLRQTVSQAPTRKLIRDRLACRLSQAAAERRVIPEPHCMRGELFRSICN